MLSNYKVEVRLVFTNQVYMLEVDPQTSFDELHQVAQEWTKIPIVQPVFEIVNINKAIRDLQQKFIILGEQNGTTITIKVYSKDEYDLLFSINLKFQILDRKEKSIKTIKIRQTKTLNDAKEILQKQFGYKDDQRDAVDIVFYKKNSDNVFNPEELEEQLQWLYIKKKNKITCRFKYLKGPPL